MASADTSRITLEFQIGADPIQGCVEHTDGTEEHFWGWLELMAHLRRAAGGAEAGATPPNPTTWEER